MNKFRPYTDFYPTALLTDLFLRCVAEDGARNDLTSNLTIEPEARGIAKIRAKSNLVLCGVDPSLEFFRLFDSALTIRKFMDDGQKARPGDAVAEIEGSMRALLAVERSALNLLMHLSGIATFTALFVEAVQGTTAKILDTRKTIPGLRGLAKWAVHCGGGHNHRIGLSDAVLIKDNHAASRGSVGRAVLAAKTEGPDNLFIETEVSNLAQLEQAMDAGANRALCDNMSPKLLTECVQRANGRIELEASGGVNLKTVAEIAKTGVNYISIGALTHSAPSADLNMKIEPA